jgi:hypothetical protein
MRVRSGVVSEVEVVEVILLLLLLLNEVLFEDAKIVW